MKKNSSTYAIWAIYAFIFVYGCSGISKFPHAITTSDARKSYLRESERKTLANWERAYESALTDSLHVTLPYGEKGRFQPGLDIVYSYNISLDEGETVVAEIAQDDPAQRVFIAIFERDGDVYRPIAKSGPGDRKLIAEAASSGIFKVVIQPEAGVVGNFFIGLSKKPTYAFPVAGKGNASIQSFWGAVRDGGKRSHEGVDIFAEKGTPVLAVADGLIVRAGEHGIGGKQVWLRTGVFGKSVYYAHLDNIAVESGNQVKTGDTLGFVGNTGNARGGAHHLHFGIYSEAGAVNPLPFIYRTQHAQERNFARHYQAATLRVKSGKATLRKGPSTDFGKIGETTSGQALTLLGQHNAWLHVRTASGVKAFVHSSLVKV